MEATDCFDFDIQQHFLDLFLEKVGSLAIVGVPLVVDMNTTAIDGEGGSAGEDEKQGYLRKVRRKLTD